MRDWIYRLPLWTPRRPNTSVYGSIDVSLSLSLPRYATKPRHYALAFARARARVGHDSRSGRPPVRVEFGNVRTFRTRHETPLTRACDYLVIDASLSPLCDRFDLTNGRLDSCRFPQRDDERKKVPWKNHSAIKECSGYVLSSSSSSPSLKSSPIKEADDTAVARRSDRSR